MVPSFCHFLFKQTAYKKLINNIFLITGCRSGIDRGLAETFHRAGSQVIVAARPRPGLGDLTAVKNGVKGVTLDINDAASIREARTQLAAEFCVLN